MRSALLRHIGRAEIPMKYVAVSKFSTFIYSLSDAQYEDFVSRIFNFTAEAIPADQKAGFLALLDKLDPTGMASNACKQVLENDVLLTAVRDLIRSMASQ